MYTFCSSKNYVNMVICVYSRIIHCYLNAIVPFAAAAAAVVSLQPVSAVTEAAGGVSVDITVVLTTAAGATLQRDLVVTLQPTDGTNGGMLKLDGVPRTQTSRLLLTYYSSRSHGTVCTTTCKGRNYCTYHVTPPHGKKMAAIPDDFERTATVALPTAASPGLVPTTTALLPH